MSRAAELLGPSGPLAREFPGYEARTGQLTMAAAIERALTEESVLFCEAGTGTGKTLAYLLPAILSGKKVVISTATRALQEQIVSKDLPLVARTFGLEPRVAVMKGLGNYLCRRRHAEFVRSAESLRPGHARALGALASWLPETETGDISELAGLGEAEPIWGEVTASSDTRLGPVCPHYAECFVTRMKREAEGAQIVVVNHHLFFADLALRGPHPGRVIPDYDAVVFDEAHQLEDIATDFFGLRVSQSRIERLLRDVTRLLTALGVADPLFATAPQIVAEVAAASAALFQELTRAAAGEDGRATVERDAWQGPLAERWHRLDSAFEACVSLLEVAGGRLASNDGPGATSSGGMAEALELCGRRSENMREQLAAIVEGARGRVTWFERSSKNAVLSSSPIDLAALFRSRVFEQIPAVILTSATLTSGRSRAAQTEAETAPSPFTFLRARLGVSDGGVQVRELVVSSPFDFEGRALLYAPRDLPAPNTPAFIERATARSAELIEITEGGAFVLTTSLRSMRALHVGLARRLRGRRVLIQGQMPKSALISAFRAAGDAVLVATLSFWEGVDVPGRALRLVILEKIPFPVPSDPIVRARSLALENEGKNPFMHYHLPTAALTLKQGFGRLIRTRSDAGVVALLDDRIHRRGYAERLLASLPPARRAHELADVQQFWRAFAAERAGASDGSVLAAPGDAAV